MIYFDTNNNSFYNPGESAGILTLEVRNAADATVASGNTFGSGGYSINLAGQPAGGYTLIARNGDGETDSVAFNWNGTTNVRADIIDPAFTVPAVLAAPYRPDAAIGLSEDQLVGKEFISASGNGQSVRDKTKSPGFVDWHASVENGGSSPDDLRITASGSTRFFRVSYLRRDGGTLKNESAALVLGRDVSLQAGETADYLIRIKPEKRALGKRKNYSLFLESLSGNDSGKSDRVTGLLLNKTVKKRR